MPDLTVLFSFFFCLVHVDSSVSIRRWTYVRYCRKTNKQYNSSTAKMLPTNWSNIPIFESLKTNLVFKGVSWLYRFQDTGYVVNN